MVMLLISCYYVVVVVKVDISILVMLYAGDIIYCMIRQKKKTGAF